MKRENLIIFTKISFMSALIKIFVISPSVFVLSKLSGGWLEATLNIIVFIAYLLSLVGIPISVVSLFSKGHILKRCSALIGNFAPTTLSLVSLTVEDINEFHHMPT